MITVRLIGTPEQARAIAEDRLGVRRVYIRTIHWVRGPDGQYNGERDFAFSSVMGGGA